jgi:nucleotide-binding universal stress UspA family protein
MYRRILVPLDGSATALGALGPARRLTRLFDAELALVTIRSPGDRMASDANIRAAAARAFGDGAITFEHLVIEADDVATALADLDRRHPDTLVCMTTRGRHPLGRALLGGVAHEVVRRSDQAVVLIGPRAAGETDGPVRRVLVCLDGTEPSEAILPWAVRWSAAAGAELHLVQVHYPLPPPEVRIPPAPEASDAARYLGEVAGRLTGQGVTARTIPLIHTEPAEAILDLARSLPDDVVALATRSPDPIMDLIVGSTFTRIIRRSPLPVLVASRPPEA